MKDVVLFKPIGVVSHEMWRPVFTLFSALDLRRKSILEYWLRRLPRNYQMGFQIVGIYMLLLEPAKTLHLLENCKKCSVGWISSSALPVQVKLMKRIAEMPDVKPILRKLPRIKKYLLNSDNIRCSVNAAPQQMSEASKEVEKFIKGITRSKKERKPVRPHVIEKSSEVRPVGSKMLNSLQITRKLINDPTFKPCPMKTHFVLPFPVNYIGECVRTVPYTATDYASLRILARLMTSKFLHREIREKGGAYGGGAKLSHNGIFTFYSYRDPNSLATLKAFEKAVEWAKSGEFTQEDIDEAKLAVFAAVDAPIAPSDKGMDHFLYGISDEMKQAHREQLFAVNKDNLVDVANEYLAVGKSTRGLAVLGPENTDITKDPSWVKR